MLSDRTRLLLRVTTGLLAILGAIVYVLSSMRFSGFDIGATAVAIVVSGIAFWVILKAGREAGEVRRGLKLEDERTRRLWEKASATTFVLSIWYILALSWYDAYFADKLSSAHFRDPSQALGTVILGMTVIFFTAYAYHSTRVTE